MLYIIYYILYSISYILYYFLLFYIILYLLLYNIYIYLYVCYTSDRNERKRLSFLVSLIVALRVVSTVTVPEQGSGEDESLSVWKNDVYVYIYM